MVDVVVGTDCEADDEVGLGVAGRQHQHRDRAVALDPPAHLEAVEAREHEVEDHEIGPEVPAPVDARRAVDGDADLEALAAEPGRHRLGDRRLVLDHQDGAGEGGRRNGHVCKG